MDQPDVVILRIPAQRLLFTLKKEIETPPPPESNGGGS